MLTVLRAKVIINSIFKHLFTIELLARWIHSLTYPSYISMNVSATVQLVSEENESPYGNAVRCSTMVCNINACRGHTRGGWLLFNAITTRSNRDSFHTSSMYTWFMQVASWSVSSAYSLGEVRRTGNFFMKTRSICCSQKYSYSVFNKYILI